MEGGFVETEISFGNFKKMINFQAVKPSFYPICGYAFLLQLWRLRETIVYRKSLDGLNRFISILNDRIEQSYVDYLRNMLLTFETYQLNSEQVTRILKEQGRPDVIDYILRMALILTMERDSKNHFIESVKSQNEVKPDLDFIFNILTRELKCTIHIYMDNPDTPIISRINNPNDELNINLLYFKQNDYWALLLHEDEIAFDNGQTCDLNRFPFIHRSNSVRPIVAPSAREPRVATRFNADFELLELTKSLTDLIQSNEISLTGNTKTILLTRMSNILSVMPDWNISEMTDFRDWVQNAETCAHPPNHLFRFFSCGKNHCLICLQDDINKRSLGKSGYACPCGKIVTPRVRDKKLRFQNNQRSAISNQEYHHSNLSNASTTQNSHFNSTPSSLYPRQS